MSREDARFEEICYLGMHHQLTLFPPRSVTETTRLFIYFSHVLYTLPTYVELSFRIIGLHQGIRTRDNLKLLSI